VGYAESSSVNPSRGYQLEETLTNKNEQYCVSNEFPEADPEHTNLICLFVATVVITPVVHKLVY
jgi:hypothetical protein